MKPIYQTRVAVVGGRGGYARSDDGILDLSLGVPKEMGGQGDAVNPEQLFAAGYAACFGNSVIHMTRNKSYAIRDKDVEVAADVGLVGNGQGGFALKIALDVLLKGVEQSKAEEIVALAHQACPYSNAIRGNIDVGLHVRTS